MSMGGWGNCDGFAPTVADPAKREKLIGQILDFCKTNGYDGVDIDWEFVSGPEERDDFTAFVKELVGPAEGPVAAPAPDRGRPFRGGPRAVDRLRGPCGGLRLHQLHDLRLPRRMDRPRRAQLPALFLRGRSLRFRGRDLPVCPDAEGLRRRRSSSASRSTAGRSRPRGSTRRRPSTEATITPRPSPSRTRAGATTGTSAPRSPTSAVRTAGTILCFDDMRSVYRKCRYVLDKGAAGVIIWEITEDSVNGAPHLLNVIGAAFGAR